MALAPSMRLGPYEVIAAIGAGGMGEVYRARDPRLGRFVALKVLPAYLSKDADRLRRFEQEARATGLLNHPNILAIYDLGTSEGAPYIVSELLEGETLRTRLGSGPLPVRKAIEYAVQIANGLAAAHSKGIVHRDLKPENLFITSDGRVKILDFGLAKLVESDNQPAGGNSATLASQTEPGMIMGTVGYMSPEQLRGQQADARSDIFALGAILYEMLSGRRAFHGETSADTISAILKEDPPELTATARNIPLALERIVRHCLEKNPAERFQSARDLAFNLEALTSASSSASGAIQVPAPSKRKWVIPALLAVVTAAALTGAFLWGRTGRPSGSPEFRQVTFRSGTVYRARFTHDGQSILYSAAWEGKPVELFIARSGRTESRSLAPDTLLAAVSSHDQLAVILQPKFLAFGSVCLSQGTLALLPLDGGAPRPILQDVQWADWAPDNSDLAVIVAVTDPTVYLNVVQFPRGKTVYTPERGWLSDVRFSPDGKYLAVGEHVPGGDDGKVVIIDRSGKKVAESPHFNSVNSLAWASEREVWFSAGRDSSRAVQAVDLQGRTRSVYSAPSDVTVHDVAADGRLLLTNDQSRMLLWGGKAGEPDRNLSWFNWSLAIDISADGSTALFSESGTGVGGTSASFLRKLEGGPALMLGPGEPWALSPDGKWVASSDLHEPANVVLLPTGVGNAEQLTSNGWDYFGVRWHPNGKDLIVGAKEPHHRTRIYLLNIASRQMRPLLPEGLLRARPSPDGKFLVAEEGDILKIFTFDGKEIRNVGKIDSDDYIDGWTADGKSILLWRNGSTTTLEKMDIISGKRTVISEMHPPDITGLVSYAFPRSTPDAKAHIYSEYRLLTDLFVVNGLH